MGNLMIAMFYQQGLDDFVCKSFSSWMTLLKMSEKIKAPTVFWASTPFDVI
jgi:hypothetical protein